ncbi:ninjurin-2 isoform X3 [Lepisosteus oculatus]|uniref:ninjurin-2 isoform X3 n=1 Tax=Lepisosteus oculatus TaxID=7918 RepID=UPI0037137F37
MTAFVRSSHFSQSGHGRRDQIPINLNHYATKKSVAESMLDVALLMANASQLKSVVEQGPEFKYYMVLLVLIGVSLFFQVVAGVLFIVMEAGDNSFEVIHKELITQLVKT